MQTEALKVERMSRIYCLEEKEGGKPQDFL